MKTMMTTMAVRALVMLSMISTMVVAAGVALVSAQPDPSLSVMSFNIRYGTADDGKDRWEKRREMLIGLLREQKADVIGVQEALHFQLQEVVQALPEYQMVGVGRSDGKTAGEYAAILYRTARLTVRSSGTFWFSDTPELVASRSWGNTIERICTWARFDDRQGRSFSVFNVHLDHRSQPSRERSVQLLRERIASREGAGDPVIVTGDFNAGEANAAVVAMRGTAVAAAAAGGAAGASGAGAAAGGAATGAAAVSAGRASGLRFVDTFRAVSPDAAEVGTFNGFKAGNTMGEKIDYIFVEPSAKVLAAEILRTSRDGRYPSDHFPVTARVQIPPR